MKIRITVLAAAAALAAGLAQTAAAGAPETPSIYAKLKPKVGAWAEYSIISKKGDAIKSKGVIRISVVGKEGDAVWLEQRITMEIPKPKKEGPMIVKSLVGADGMQKMFVKMGDRVMDMTSMEGRAARERQQTIAKAKNTEVGEESVEVAAGKYKATHYSFDDGTSKGDHWVKPGVGPYGLIKQTHSGPKGSGALELLSSGDGAKSEVDESTAQSFGSMMGGQAPSGAAGAPGMGSNPSNMPPGMSDMIQNAMKRRAAAQGNQ
jgi:hypothetical protein